MKSFILLLTVSLLSLGTCLAFLLPGDPSGRTDVSVKDTRTAYSFTASFSRERTAQVRRFLDSSLSAEKKQFPAAERAVLQYKLSAGKLKIHAAKPQPSTAALNRVKALYQDIRYVIIPRN